VGVGAYLYAARRHAPTVLEPGVIPVVRVAQAGALKSVRSGPHVAFRNLEAGTLDGTLSFVSLTDQNRRRYATDLVCDRLYFSDAAGVCLVSERRHHKVTLGYLLDEGLTVRSTFSTVGVPSRARVSSDGRRAAYTVFTARDSYMAAGFSTRTHVLELSSDGPRVDLETFTVTRDGAPFRSADFNFWGVTFGDASDQFYATLSSRGRAYLVRGDIATKQMTVVHDGIECPSISPDGSRVAFKKRINPARWRPAVLDLQTGGETVLDELRNVDDQLEWLDDEHVLYAVRTWTGKSVKSDIWMASVDGRTAPALFLADAESPSVLRRGASEPQRARNERYSPPGLTSGAAR
jgi:hypothetical protein